MADKKCLKRVRNPNFSLIEKRMLLQCAYEEKLVIENKKTDGVTWKEKEAAWERITASFNSQSATGCHRSVEALKKFYQAYKKEIRKIAADEKLSVIQTGGGKAQHVTDPNFDLALSIMNPKTIEGFDNIPDGDGVDELFLVAEDQPCSSTKNNDEKRVEIAASDWTKYKPSHLKQPVHPKLKTRQAVDDSLSEDADDPCADSNYNPNIDVPMSKGFKKQFTTSSSNLDEKKQSTWSDRRRPVASTLPSTKISEQYSQLSAIKIELAKLQYDTQKEEAIQKKYTNSIEHELRKTSLELDIEIKTELLKQIKKNSIQPAEACSVLKNLQNIDPFLK